MNVVSENQNQCLGSRSKGQNFNQMYVHSNCYLKSQPSPFDGSSWQKG